MPRPVNRRPPPAQIQAQAKVLSRFEHLDVAPGLESFSVQSVTGLEYEGWVNRISHLAALLLAPLANGCGGDSNSAPPPAEACLAQGNTVEGGGSVAQPGHCTRACNADSECTAVNISCPGCCNFRPMSRSYSDSYSNTKRNDCRAYTGLVCSCDEKPPQARCVNHMCEFKN